MRLYEVIQLVEYNKGATLNNWGERIAKAAKFNHFHMEDQWLVRGYSSRTKDIDDDKIASDVLTAFEKMDPTKNKQYVQTLVRWYIGNIKKHNQLQAQYDDWRQDANLDRYGEMDYADSSYPEAYYDLELIADDFDDFHDDFGNYVMNPENLDTFKIEDAEQIKTALERYNSMKPQLQPNERDIGRFKTFYRFEDFVDSKMDPEQKQEIEDDMLNRKDVKVLYNGPMGTVTIPYTQEASCLLGKGTKWCTAAKTNNFFKHYSEQGDLIIYNEKPGNEKYQIHVTFRGIEIRDSRDREINFSKRKEFTEDHPVISKIINKQKLKILIDLRDTPFDPMEYQNWMGQIDNIIDFNAKHHGKPLRFIDEFWTEPDAFSGGLSPYIKKGNIPKQTLDQLMKYAVSRNKRWPEIEAMFLQMFNNAFGPESDNWNKHNPQMVMTSLDRMMSQLKPYVDKYKWPELDQFRNNLLTQLKSQEPDKEDINSNMNEMRRLINIVESAQHEQVRMQYYLKLLEQAETPEQINQILAEAELNEAPGFLKKLGIFTLMLPSLIMGGQDIPDPSPGDFLLKAQPPIATIDDVKDIDSSGQNQDMLNSWNRMSQSILSNPGYNLKFLEPGNFPSAEHHKIAVEVTKSTVPEYVKQFSEFNDWLNEYGFMKGEGISKQTYQFMQDANEARDVYLNTLKVLKEPAKTLQPTIDKYGSGGEAFLLQDIQKEYGPEVAKNVQKYLSLTKKL